MSSQNEVIYPFWSMITFNVEGENEDSRQEFYNELTDAGWEKSDETNTTFFKEFTGPHSFRNMLDKYSDEEDIVLKEIKKIAKKKIKKDSGMLLISKNKPVRFP